MIQRISNFKGSLKFDETKPEGTPVKRLNVEKINGLKWQASHSLEEGLQQVWDWYCHQLNDSFSC